MNKLYFVGLLVGGSLVSLLCTVQTSAYSIHQYIAPLECVIDELNNGYSSTVILSPQECNDYLNSRKVEKPNTKDEYRTLIETQKKQLSVIMISPSKQLSSDEPNLSPLDKGAESPLELVNRTNDLDFGKKGLLVTIVEIVIIMFVVVCLVIMHGRRLEIKLKHWYNHR